MFLVRHWMTWSALGIPSKQLIDSTVHYMCLLWNTCRHLIHEETLGWYRSQRSIGINRFHLLWCTSGWSIASIDSISSDTDPGDPLASIDSISSDADPGDPLASIDSISSDTDPGEPLASIDSISSDADPRDPLASIDSISSDEVPRDPLASLFQSPLLQIPETHWKQLLPCPHHPQVDVFRGFCPPLHSKLWFFADFL